MDFEYEEFNASNTKKWVEVEGQQHHFIEPYDLGSRNTPAESWDPKSHAFLAGGSPEY